MKKMRIQGTHENTVCDIEFSKAKLPSQDLEKDFL